VTSPVDRARLDAARAALDAIPHVRLGVWPTPVERFAGPSAAWAERIWVKREDRASPLYGGNKVRKLEYLLATGRGPVVAFGGLGSHHVLATALHAAILGRECYGVLAEQPVIDHTAAVLALNARECAGLVRWRSPLAALRALRRLTSAVAAGADGRPARPSVLFPGGSSPVGTLGWVGGGLELAGQIASSECPAPEEIYVAYGSGGTAVGLALGLALAGVTCAVVAVRVATRLAGNRRYAALLARRTFALLAERADLGPMPALRLELRHGFAGAGYGHPTAEAEEAIRLAAASNLPLEPTYTGKALAALLAAARCGGDRRTRMFLDTYCSIDNLKTARTSE
jgi:1-aminocyclopropane-1-carboxylate deaminase/D-cysteine desulfhydrase-like pyridoxal-dependent ACC family enzyme